MKTLEQLKKEQTTARAILKREHAMALALPLPPARVMDCGKRAPWATYKINTVAEGLAMFRTFADAGLVVNMENARGRYRHVSPASERSESPDTVTHVSDAALALKVDYMHDSRSTSAEFFFYVRVAGKLCRVCLDFEFRAAPLARMAPGMNEHRHSYSNRVDSRTFSANPALNGYAYQTLSYASGDTGPVKTSAQHVYLFAADDGDTCREFTEMFLILQNIADEFDTTGAA